MDLIAAFLLAVASLLSTVGSQQQQLIVQPEPPSVTMRINAPSVTEPCTFYGKASYFNADWQHVIAVNKAWGNLPRGYIGYGNYAAVPEKYRGYYGKWATVTWHGKARRVQLVDVVAYKDTAWFERRGRVIDLGESVFAGFLPDYKRQDEGILSGVCVRVEG